MLIVLLCAGMVEKARRQGYCCTYQLPFCTRRPAHVCVFRSYWPSRWQGEFSDASQIFRSDSTLSELNPSHHSSSSSVGSHATSSRPRLANSLIQRYATRLSCLSSSRSSSLSVPWSFLAGGRPLCAHALFRHRTMLELRQRVLLT